MAELLGRKVYLRDGSGMAVIEDVAIERNRLGEWDVGQLFLRRPRTSASPFAKGPTTFAGGPTCARSQIPGEAQSAEQLVATYSELKPADLANTLLDLPEDRLIEVAEELTDDRLADALEEMPEDEQVHILERSATSAPPTSSTRWSPTTPPTCSASCPRSGRKSCST